MYQKNEYEELLAYHRPVSSHPHMSQADRAKIFSPFAALRGHGEAVAKMQEERCNRVILSEEEQWKINQTLCQIKKQEELKITWFYFQPGPDGTGGVAEGYYCTTQGTVRKIDSVAKGIEIFDTEEYRVNINFMDILKIERCGP